MESSIIELPGCEVAAISLTEGILRIQFQRAYILKTMTGAVERTRWWQAGDLVLEGAEVSGAIPTGPLVCAGGDVGENAYTYRDMLPIPLDSRGLARCALRFQGQDQPLLATGTAIRLEMREVPKYIEHVRPLR